MIKNNHYKYPAFHLIHYVVLGIISLVFCGFISGYGFRLNLSQSLPEKFYLSIPISNVKRGQIVTFSMPQSKVIFAKKVAGVAGDKLTIEGDKIFINGYCEGNIGIKPNGLEIISGDIPDGFFFALGCSDDSFDSRYKIFGFVPVSSVKERLWAIF